MKERSGNPGRTRRPATRRAEPKGIDELESPSTPTLFRTYGEFWNPELVRITGKRLMGIRKSKRKSEIVNVYGERGIYVLFKEFQPVYVGKADGESIGARIQKHRKSQRKGARWDQFSWFGLCGITTGRQARVKTLNDSFHPTAKELISTLEALLIATIDPRLNSRKEKFKNAVRIYQSDEDRPIAVEDRLDSIESTLGRLAAHRGSE